MVVISVNLLPVLVPIEHQNAVVITATQHVRQSRVHNQMTNEISVLSGYGLELLTRIIIVNSDFRVI